MVLALPMARGGARGGGVCVVRAYMVERAARRAFAGLPGNHAVGSDQVTPPPRMGLEKINEIGKSWAFHGHYGAAKR